MPLLAIEVVRPHDSFVVAVRLGVVAVLVVAVAQLQIEGVARLPAIDPAQRRLIVGGVLAIKARPRKS
ncbi:hypothetical protein EH240_05720 [Mesorhizobium tamadayense]|uniref:Uncharacterized protein n=1 Tax=Mesorhizobium tamadayense TaxID=425306 RepID=A0A3P3G3F5_9HYPH|nr:hypothetical protein [Mesorhizobium tamadayense]RRI05388.1 hypothetical protein EH240_05720 [Mesorhizobium tamadayense]